MDARARLTPIPIAPLLPPWRKLLQPMEPALHGLLVPERVEQAVNAACHLNNAADFARSLLDSLGIAFAVDAGCVSHVPAKGPLLIVANHPFGIVEGLALAALLDRVRPDSKILANALLASLPALRDKLILVNAFESDAAPAGEFLTLAHAMRLAGARRSIGDLSWRRSRLGQLDGASCDRSPMEDDRRTPGAPCKMPRAPRLFRRRQQHAFSSRRRSASHPADPLAGPRIRASERNHGPFAHRPSDPCERTGCVPRPGRRHKLPANTNLFSCESVRAGDPTDHVLSQAGPDRRADGLRAVACGGSSRSPGGARLAANGEFAVYLAPADAIPRLLEEIGRCREIAFREAGEGTGESADLDRFDRHYQHLFLWSSHDSRLAGAYRLAITTDVLPQFGINGLYTGTLFRYRPEFFERVGPAVELGRSFVMPEYLCVALVALVRRCRAK